MTYGLPLWLIIILSIGFVLGPLLAGIGAIMAARAKDNSAEVAMHVASLRIEVNGRLSQLIDASHKAGIAEGIAIERANGDTAEAPATS